MNEEEIRQNEILSVSTIVNGITKEELPAILNQLDKIRVAIKMQAFETVKTEVAQKGISVAKTKMIIDAVTVRIEQLPWLMTSQI